jgi:hypothetical protein
METLFNTHGECSDVRILAIDQARERSGVCRVLRTAGGAPLFDFETRKSRETGVACLPKWRDFIVDEVAIGYALIVIECPVVLTQSNLILFQISGVILEYCTRQSQPFLVVNNGDNKNYACGDVHATKLQMIAAAKTLIGGDAKITDDEADAIWLAHLGYYHAGKQRTGNLIRDSILKRLTKSPEQLREEKRAADLAKAERKIEIERRRQARLAGGGRSRKAVAA